MAKKFIGIEFDSRSLRVAVAEAGKSGAVLVATEEHPLSSGHSLAETLAKVLDELTFGDRVCASLPAVGSFFRKLEYPFADARKIDAALSLDLASQIPVDEELLCDFHAPRASGDIYQVTAAAVKKKVASELQAVFGEAGVPLQVLDLSPFAYVAGLRHQVSDGLLAAVMESELSVARVKGGRIIDLRSLPLKPGQTSEQLGRLLERTCLSLAHPDGETLPPLYVLGSGVTQQLLEVLSQTPWRARVPELAVAGRRLDAAHIPAAALALRAALPQREKQFNFLKGELAPRSEWQVFRRRLIAAAALAVVTLGLAASAAYLNLAQKNTQAESLRQDMVSLYRQTFPRATAIIDVHAQMRSEHAQLQQRAQMLGLGSGRSALGVLREISQLAPTDTNLEIRELAYTGEQIRLEGLIASFEAINRLARSLEESPLFEGVQIADAKTSIDGSQVDFRLSFRTSAMEVRR